LISNALPRVERSFSFRLVLEVKMDLSDEYFKELRVTFLRIGRHFIHLTSFYNNHGIFFPKIDEFFYNLKFIFNMQKSDIDSICLLFIFAEFKRILQMYKSGDILEEPLNYIIKSETFASQDSKIKREKCYLCVDIYCPCISYHVKRKV
jgi:hypothetical protein